MHLVLHICNQEFWMELSNDYEKFGLKIKHQLSNDYQKSENGQLVTFLLRCLYTILSVEDVRKKILINKKHF